MSGPETGLWEAKDEVLDESSATRRLTRYLTFSFGDNKKFTGL
jgi:hypothetical protein